MVQISGITDEASDVIETQIAVHQILGWQAIELRTVESWNVSGDQGSQSPRARRDQASSSSWWRRDHAERRRS